MNNLSIVIFCSLFSIPSFANEKSFSEPSSVEQEIKRFSKYQGYKIAKEMKATTEWIDFQSVVEGIQEFSLGIKPNEDDVLKNDDYFPILYELIKKEAETNLQKANLFFEQLAPLPSIHTLEKEKLYYEILTPGSTLVVEKESSPILHYTITTLAGQEVDSTYKRASPQKVALSETILGFQRGVEGMLKGEKRKIYIHPDLGYGIVGPVPPNSTLIVEVEVVQANSNNSR